MINIIALCLVFTTLATAGVWSPTPATEKQQFKRNVIVKEGHRTVEIEYRQEDGNTKVKISPQEGQAHVDSASTLRQKVSEAGENVEEKFEEIGHRMSPRELVCDAFGKCKHKMASAIEKTKVVVTDKTHEAKDRVEEVEERAKEAVGDTVERMKDAVSKIAHEAADKAHEIKEKVKEAPKEAIDIGKALKHDVRTNLSKRMEEAKRIVERAEGKNEHKQKDWGEIISGGGEFVGDVFRYVLPPESRASGVGITQLLGLGVAYGMSIWVTFISSYIMAGALPRHQFAILQSKIYPVYFRAMAYSVGMLLLAHWLSPRKKLYSSKVEMVQGFNLLTSLLMLLFNLRYLEPRATKVMFERMKLEKEEGKGLESATVEATNSRGVESFPEKPSSERSATTTAAAAPASAPQRKWEDAAAKSELARASETLKRLNSYSSLLNILTLMALTWHLVHLGQILHTATTECS